MSTYLVCYSLVKPDVVTCKHRGLHATGRQSIVNGFQHEQPDYWLTFGNPWEIERLIVSYPIKFYGHVSVANEDGKQVFKWNAGEQVRCWSH